MTEVVRNTTADFKQFAPSLALASPTVIPDPLHVKTENASQQDVRENNFKNNGNSVLFRIPFKCDQKMNAIKAKGK